MTCVRKLHCEDWPFEYTMPVPSNPSGEDDDDAIMALMGPQSGKSAKQAAPNKNKESQWASIGELLRFV